MTFNHKIDLHPKDFPIQFFCIIFTLFGQDLRLSNELKRSSENLVMLKPLIKFFSSTTAPDLHPSHQLLVHLQEQFDR